MKTALMIVVNMIAAVAVDMGLQILGFTKDKILIGLINHLVVIKNTGIINVIVESLKQFVNVMAV